MELTPAQQCVKDGHAIPTVTLPPGVHAVRRSARAQTLGGWAFLDANTPIIGGRVRIVGPHGRTVRLLRGSTATTRAGGTFLVAVRTLPHGFRIEVAGGRRNGKRFNGVLVAAGTTGTAYVSPVSTMISAYRRAYPRRTQSQATAAVRRTLAIPATANLTTYLRSTNRLFSAQRFLARGPFGHTIRLVVSRAAAGRRLAFPGRAAPRGVGTDLLKWGGKQLANGAVAYIGGQALGWVLGQIGIGSGADDKLAEVKDALDKISSQLTELSLQLKDLKTAADRQLVETLVANLKLAESAVSGKLGDLQSIAAMAAAPHDKAYLESQACEKLAGLYPLASGTDSYGYVPDLLNHAVFPSPQSTPLTTAFINVIKGKSRWFTSASSDEVAEALGYWEGVEQSWLQVELEWQHAVHPCPTTPAPTSTNCLALHWAGRYVSDTQAQNDTLPLTVPGGIFIDTNTKLAWAPAYSPAGSVLPHAPPATYADTFGPRGDYIACPGQDPKTGQCGPSRSVKGIAGACQDNNSQTMLPNARDIDVCAIYLKDLARQDTGPFNVVSGRYPQTWDWWPPTGGELGTLVKGYREAGFSSPLDYLSKPWSEGGAGAARAWFDQGNGKLWIWPCTINARQGCDALDLANGATGQQAGDGKAGFLVTSHTPIPETRYFINGGSTQFVGGGPGNSYVVYVAESGNDTRGSGSNDCSSYLLPCRTLSHAVAVAGYAKVIELGGGTFSGAVTLDKDTTIVGAGAGLTTITGGGGGPTVNVATVARLEGVTVAGGSPGIQVSQGGRLTLVDSSVARNQSQGVSNQGTITVLRSTIGPSNSDYGFSNVGSATIVNSTIGGNALSGLTNFRGNAALTLVNDTVTGNGYFGLSNSDQSSSVRITNTLLAKNDVAGHGLGDCTGNVGAGPAGHNLIGKLGNCSFDQSGSAGNIVGTDARLGPLGTNGGPTPTAPLLTGSPAIDAGDSATCAAAPVSGVDQRGYVRPSGSCAIGAFDSKAQNIPTP